MDDFSKGFLKTTVEIPVSLQNLIQKGQFEEVYKEFICAMDDGQFLSNILKSLFPESYKDRPFSHELMLSLRSGPQDEEEEGIWHDDSSRDLIFSLSLTRESEIVRGGHLSLRKMVNRDEVTSIATQPFGTLLFFPSGKSGWEHKISRVTSGNRLVLVGWLTFH